jgi:hypothetical protein
VNPGDNGQLENAYMITNAFLQSSQGMNCSIYKLNVHFRDLFEANKKSFIDLLVLPLFINSYKITFDPKILSIYCYKIIAQVNKVYEKSHNF